MFEVPVTVPNQTLYDSALSGQPPWFEATHPTFAANLHWPGSDRFAISSTFSTLLFVEHIARLGLATREEYNDELLNGMKKMEGRNQEIS